MWIFTTESFLAIKQHRDRPDLLVVRARVNGDIENLFPDATVITDPDADYLYRSIIPKHKVAAKLFDMVADIDYLKFKSSVVDKRREAYYLDVWFVMDDMQYALQSDD
jgi:hypothetical protein